MFLRSCDFEMELTKKTLTLYYALRKKYPQYWKNRNFNHEPLKQIFNRQWGTVLTNSRADQPAVLILSSERFLDNPSLLNDHIKVLSVTIDVLVRRQNAQTNGITVIYDFKDYKWRLLLRCLSPTFAKDIVNNFYYPMPTKINQLIVINTPYLANKLLHFLLKCLPPSFKNNFITYGSDWPTLHEHVPMEIIPEEFGGQGGSFKSHEDAFRKELLAYNDYLMEDEQYE
ncbi:hypothetical protein CHUAL_008174 [Chamberlinius hualienensis]